MTFQAYDIALDLIRSLREPLARIQARDPDLEKQLRRGASSVALNLGEGRRRQGRDRNHLFRVAAGSAGEVAASLAVGSVVGGWLARLAGLHRYGVIAPWVVSILGALLLLAIFRAVARRAARPD